MSPPSILSAFLSVSPLEPVLVFSSPEDAAMFQSRCKQARIMPSARQSWVYLPMPDGLVRVRTARMGDVAFDFDSEKSAKEFNASIKHLGRVFENRKGDRGWEKVVYLGKEKI
ncbi:hypothetical protein HBH70_144270 [Parastagonospora nodorum]|nr:hypothetical protein HBH51_100460 [Parastagonospora nodorum]KAH3993733.1 hypothetical protein HBI10_197120 [Parastagonospora nodorum]KAH4012889.1 hypothetical protein HBI13_184170 [Parastagonospora nodorum]KAH4020733.1 hypothetical protein HBI09_179320 [Parastagonospora nodorum]KAH4064394.1 hypothetical protein HBH50_178610 [Parastagonospora nodorum]